MMRTRRMPAGVTIGLREPPGIVMRPSGGKAAE
jgi:hypothetical protein